LARKPWARRELLGRLRRRGAPEDVALAVVTDLEARGYIDDRAFATNWAEVRARGRALGSRRLRQELVGKGVGRPLVETAIQAAFAETDELTRARRAAARRWPALRGARAGSGPRRLHDHLLRRGYPADIVRRVVRETCGDVPGPMDGEAGA
jgi:regulatory protein